MRMPWSYSWNVVGLTLVFQAITIGTLIYCFSLFVVPWQEAFDISRGRVMIAITVLQLGVGALSPFAGRAMDAFSMRGLVIGGGVALAAGLLLASMATAMWQIIMLYALLLPIGMALTGPLAAQTLVTRWFQEKRGMALGISAIGTSIGGFGLPFLTSFLIDTTGWRNALQILALVAVIVIIPLSAWILRRRPPNPEPMSGGTASQAADLREWQVPDIVRAPMFWITVGCFLPINLAFGAIQFNLAAYTADLGFPTRYGALLISLSSACMILGKFAFGAAADRIDHRYLYCLMAGGMGISLLMLMGQPGLPMLISAAALMGVSGGGILTLLGVIYGSRFGATSFGRVMGLAMLFMTTASFGPLLSGWLHDVTGSYDIAFGLFAACFVPAMIAITRLPAPAVTTAPR